MLDPSLPDLNTHRLALVLGGARSGKSSLAETLLERTSLPLTYIATAEAHDDEMTARIAEHRARRGTEWTTVDAPTDLPAVFAAIPPANGVLLDCLTLWLSNLMFAGIEIEPAFADLRAAMAPRTGPVVMVSNEVGMGLVPDTPLGRSFRDHQGRLNQHAAAAADLVIFTAAGLPLILKDTPV